MWFKMNSSEENVRELNGGPNDGEKEGDSFVGVAFKVKG
jgi:hypothetical protein